VIVTYRGQPVARAMMTQKDVDLIGILPTLHQRLYAHRPDRVDRFGLMTGFQGRYFFGRKWGARFCPTAPIHGTAFPRSFSFHQRNGAGFRLDWLAVCSNHESHISLNVGLIGHPKLWFVRQTHSSFRLFPLPRVEYLATLYGEKHLNLGQSLQTQ